MSGNNVNPNHTQLCAASDQGLHCFVCLHVPIFRINTVCLLAKLINSWVCISKTICVDRNTKKRSQTAAFPRRQEEEETDKTKKAQIEQMHEKHQDKPCKPKRGNRNAKRTEKHKNKIPQGKTQNKPPRRTNHKATKSKTTGTSALERSVE